MSNRASKAVLGDGRAGFGEMCYRYHAYWRFLSANRHSSSTPRASTIGSSLYALRTSTSSFRYVISLSYSLCSTSAYTWASVGSPPCIGWLVKTVGSSSFIANDSSLGVGEYRWVHIDRIIPFTGSSSNGELDRLCFAASAYESLVGFILIVYYSEAVLFMFVFGWS